MGNLGNKHICKKCKLPYYDLGKEKHSCPSCFKTSKSNFKTKSNKQKKKKENEALEDISCHLELIRVFKSGANEGNAISVGQIELPDENLKQGWYVAPVSEIKKKKITSKNALLFLGEFPSRGMQIYLSSSRFTGIGSVTAEKIISEHSENLFKFLKEKPNEIETQLGVSKDHSKALSEGWNKEPKENTFMIFMNELEFLETQIREIASKIGAEVITLINRNPFSLVKILPRFNFHDVERLCKRLSIAITEEQRILAGTEFYLGDVENRLRHTCMPVENTLQRVSELRSINKEAISKTLEQNKKEFIYKERRGKEVVASSNSAKRDFKIANEMKQLIDEHKPLSKGMVFDGRNIETSEGITLSDEQIDAINAAVKSPISVITGGPGSGKTTLVQGLVSALKTLNADARLSAPTGRAAKRISETPGLSDLGPSTIHMFLAKERASKSSSEFDVMIVDEASMIDVELMVELLEAIPAGASIIFIGDVDQLPPVGPGQPFKDLIESEMVQVSRLTGNFRQASFSNTIKAARNIIQGKTPVLSSDIAQSDFTFSECPPQKQAETILNLYFDILPNKFKIDPRDIQIISPQRPGEVGVLRLNDLIQQKLTAKTKLLFTKKSGNHDVAFYVGDKVIQRKNNYELKVMNGDQGIITRESGQHLMVEFDGVEIEYDGLQRFDLDLSYATTIHSSQGSEYPAVIIPVVSAHAYMLSRNLIYTAVTRGKQQVCVVGEKAALEKALALYQKDFRWTCLSEYLKEVL